MTSTKVQFFLLHLFTTQKHLEKERCDLTAHSFKLFWKMPLISTPKYGLKNYLIFITEFIDYPFTVYIVPISIVLARNQWTGCLKSLIYLQKQGVSFYWSPIFPMLNLTETGCLKWLLGCLKDTETPLWLTLCP